MAYDESTGTTSVVTIKTRSNIKDSITRCGGSITKCFTKIYIQDGHMVSLNSQPHSALFLRTKDKNEIYKIQLSSVRDSLLSASSAFNGRCLRQKVWRTSCRIPNNTSNVNLCPFIVQKCCPEPVSSDTVPLKRASKGRLKVEKRSLKIFMAPSTRLWHLV